MVRLIQMFYRDRTVPEYIVWVTMVLLPKGKGEYRGIGIVEVLWNVCSVMVNCWLKRTVVMHHALHGFREGKGIGMVTLEAKLEQHLEVLAHGPLFHVFFEVQKAYGSLDREQCL